MTDCENVYLQTQEVLAQLLQSVNPRPGHIIVLSCSISRVEGRREDTTGSPDLADAIFRAVREHLPCGLYIAVQCCEHLNRALIIERDLMESRGLAEVSVIPTPRAGGTFAATAYRHFSDPVVVESIAADMGIDIGLTMIGMHLKPVVMPVLTNNEYIGGARVVAARTRPKLIGGDRATYRR